MIVTAQQSSTHTPDPVLSCAWPPQRSHQLFAPDDSWNVDKQSPAIVRILIVEDDYLVAAQMESVLTQAGFEIMGLAASAEEAIRLVDAERPSLVLMDVRLAGKRDGIDAAIELFRSYGVRSILATAHHNEETRRRAGPAAPLGWLPKPYAMASLVETVRQALRDISAR